MSEKREFFKKIVFIQFYNVIKRTLNISHFPFLHQQYTKQIMHLFKKIEIVRNMISFSSIYDEKSPFRIFFDFLNMP